MSTVDIDKQLREVLWYELGDGLNATDVDNAVHTIKATLKAELLAKMPEKKHHIESDRNIAYREGFNDAVTKITKIVNEL